MLAEPRQAYLLLGLEPELDCWDGNLALRALQGAEFVVSLSAYRTEAMDSYAHVLLPLALFAETSGTYINNEGRRQSFTGASAPPGEARPGWKILRVLGNMAGVPGFEYNTSTDVQTEVEGLLAGLTPDNTAAWKFPDRITRNGAGLKRCSLVTMNAIDPVTRRAQALQQTMDAADGAVHLNAELAATLGLAPGQPALVSQDEYATSLPVVVDERVPPGSVLIHAAHPCHARLGPWYGAVKVSKA